MPSLGTPTGRLPWPLLAQTLAAEFAVLCLAWVLVPSSLLQAVLLVACLFPLHLLSRGAADVTPFPTVAEHEKRRRDRARSSRSSPF